MPVLRPIRRPQLPRARLGSRLLRPQPLGLTGLVWVNTTGSGSTTNASPAFPATGVANGDTIYVAVCNDLNSGSGEPPAVPAPSGWTQVDAEWGGTGTAGLGTGPRKVTVHARDALADGTENGTTLTNLIPKPSTSTFVYAFLFGIRPITPGNTFAYAGSAGSDTVSDTSFSAATAADPGITTGDLVLVLYGCPEDTSTSMSAEAITTTGVTYGTVTERHDSGTSSGNNCRLVMASVPVTAGTSSSTSTVTGTLGAATTGVGMVVRVRETAPVGAAAVPPFVSQYSGRW